MIGIEKAIEEYDFQHKPLQIRNLGYNADKIEAEIRVKAMIRNQLIRIFENGVASVLHGKELVASAEVANDAGADPRDAGATPAKRCIRVPIDLNTG